VLDTAIGVADVEIDTVEQGVFLDQQPAPLRMIGIAQAQVEPVRTVGEPEGRAASGQRQEFADGSAREHLFGARRRRGLVQIGRVRL